jgi:hypothetical protein
MLVVFSNCPKSRTPNGRCDRLGMTVMLPCTHDASGGWRAQSANAAAVRHPAENFPKESCDALAV